MEFGIFSVQKTNLRGTAKKRRPVRKETRPAKEFAWKEEVEGCGLTPQPDSQNQKRDKGLSGEMEKKGKQGRELEPVEVIMRQ